MTARRLLTGAALVVAALLIASCASPRQVHVDRWPEGKPWRKGELVRGKQTGRWSYWHADATKQAEGRFLDDSQDGLWTWWYANAQIQSTGAFSAGQRVGEWAGWHETGKRQYQGAYGTAITAKLKPGEGRADRQHGLWRYWRADGSLAAIGWFDNGSRSLIWSYFSTDGSLAEQGAYWSGAKIGPWRELKNGTLTWVDHGCPAGYGCYREPSAGAPRRWGMLKDQRSTGLWIVFGENGAPRYTDLSHDGVTDWLAWREQGSLLAAGRRDGSPFEQFFTEAGTTMVVMAATDAPPTPGEDTIEEAKAAVAAGEAAARATLVTTVVAAQIAPPDPAPKPAVIADLPLTAVSILPGWWTPKEEGVAKDLIKAYAKAKARMTSYDDWEPAAKPADRKDLVGKSLTQTRVLSAEGEVIDLADFQGKQQVLLVILRGFSGQVCIYCAAQTAALVDNLSRFTAANTRVVLLYPGSADSVSAFIQAVKSLNRDLPPELVMAIDPDLNLVRSLGIEDMLAKPSTIILDKQGKVRWTYVGANKADRPAVDTMLTQISRLP